MEYREQLFGKAVEWRETYRPVLAGPVDVRALCFILPLMIWPRWPMTPILIIVVLSFFVYLMSRKVEPDNVWRMMRSYTAGRTRWAVPRVEYRRPKTFAFEDQRMIGKEASALRKAIEKADLAPVPDEDLPVRKIRIANCRMG